VFACGDNNQHENASSLTPASKPMFTYSSKKRAELQTENEERLEPALADHQQEAAMQT
jgi:hypothetical protein